MGSDHHYAEERPVHKVHVDGFWIDKYPVTNARFARFIASTGYVTIAEIPPDPKNYPGALPEMLFQGSLVFVKSAQRVDPRTQFNWWHWTRGADWRHPQGVNSSLDGLDM
jgi:formylglycine-generating enzyme required for sulfatase activity